MLFRCAARHQRQKGLTLIELLIAITVLAVVAVLGWRGLDSIVRSRIALTADMERTRGVQLAFAQLERDCANIISPEMFPNRPPLVAEQQRLLLIRKVFTDNQPVRLQVVAYRVRDGVLSRRESRPTRDLSELESAWLLNNDSVIAEEVGLEANVSAFTVRIWVQNAVTWRAVDINAPQMITATSSSAAAGTSTTRNASPLKGLEVSLQLQGTTGPLTKVFLLGAV
nr:prepilin-type N-terminal cleavage/methylation domain-containing protein [uncultured Noviherbaspirillum sp.]